MNVMKAWSYVMGASMLALVPAACSDDSSHEPSGQSGSAGAAQGGEPGSAGSAGAGGSNQQAGGSTGTPVAGDANGGTGGDSEGGGAGAGAAPSGPYQAVIGQVCPVESRIGLVQLAGFPAPYVQVTLYDRPDPWIGEPELSTPTCDFHHYTAGQCGACDAGQTCSLDDTCVPERRTIKDATLVVSAGAAERDYAADPELGGIYSTVDIGNSASSYSMTLSWGDTQVQLGAMPVASADLANLAITIEGDSSMPGALEATWEPSSPGAFVRSTIPINHHAAGPTFTECAAPESAGAFHADAAMIDPLAVITGLEFQGVEHVFVAAATIPEGCVEFRFGEQILVFPN
jgi:hypothetical protein